MKRSILLLLFIFVSCTIPYDAETRLLLEVKIVDSNENNISDMDLEVNVTSGYNIETISYGKTDENGELKLIFPSPEFDQGYNLYINSKYDDDTNYVPLEIGHITNEDFTDYKLSIPKIYRLTYQESVQIFLDFNNTIDTRKIVNASVNGIYTPSNSYFPDSDETLYQYNFFAKKNQTIQIMYKVKDFNTGIVQTLIREIIVNEDDIFQTINY